MAQKHCSNDYQSMSNYVSLYDLNLQPFSTYLIYLLYYIYSKFILNILSNIYYIIYIYLLNQFTLCKTKKKLPLQTYSIWTALPTMNVSMMKKV